MIASRSSIEPPYADESRVATASPGEAAAVVAVVEEEDAVVDDDAVTTSEKVVAPVRPNACALICSKLCWLFTTCFVYFCMHVPAHI